MMDVNEKNKNLLEENREILSKLEEWMSTQPHMPKNLPRTIMLRYFKVCKFDLEETKKLIDINVKFRSKHKYLFTDRDINSEDLQRAVKNMQYSAFPKLTKERYAIESYRLTNTNLNDFILKDIIKFVLMVNDVHGLMEPDINGVIAIYDATGFTFSHFMKFVSSVQCLIHFSQYGQEACGVNMTQIHLVNCSKMLTRVVAFLKPFINDDVYSKLKFHPSGYETLNEMIERDCLPVDYGGCGGTLEEYSKNTLNNVCKYREFLKTDDNFFLANE